MRNGRRALRPVGASDWEVQQSELCDAALRQAESRYHLPANLLQSIAKAESGRPITSLADIRAWPWTIDADGTGLFLDSKAAAIAWVQQQVHRHSFVDVGCMQVDLHYHPDAFASIDDAFDPTANADYAARLLLDLYPWRGRRQLGYRRRAVSLADADACGGIPRPRGIGGRWCAARCSPRCAAIRARHSSRHPAAGTGRRQGGADQCAPPASRTVAPPIHRMPDRRVARSVSQQPGAKWRVRRGVTLARIAGARA